MRRLLFAAPLAIFVLVAGCGDDDADDGDQAQAAATEQSPVSNPNEQPQAPDKQLPTPTPIPDTLPLVQVVAGGNTFTPTRPEFADLPKTTVEAAGKTYEGVTLAALAEKAGAGSGATATIQGTRIDNLRLGAIRFALSEIVPPAFVYFELLLSRFPNTWASRVRSAFR